MDAGRPGKFLIDFSAWMYGSWCRRSWIDALWCLNFFLCVFPEGAEALIVAGSGREEPWAIQFATGPMLTSGVFLEDQLC